MLLRNCTFDEFEHRTKNSQVVCFGVGQYLDSILQNFPEANFKISYFVDNNKTLWGKHKTIGDSFYIIQPPSFLFENLEKNTLVFITGGPETGLEIFDELNKNSILDKTECYLAHAVLAIHSDSLSYNTQQPELGYRMNAQPIIPKTIHYCWFGHGEMPKWNMECIESWRKFCPEYKIIEWNETNYDVTKNQYTNEAYRAKKWGFVPDYARLDIIYQHGGIYLDVDVEIIHPLDELLYNSAFCGFDKTTQINFGSGFGAVKQFDLMLKMMMKYDDLAFINENGTYNLEPSPLYQTEVAVDCGLLLNGNFQVIDGMAFYPAEYFAPLSPLTLNMMKTDKTFSIHWYDASWFTQSEHKSRKKWKDLMTLAEENEKSLS